MYVGKLSTVALIFNLANKWCEKSFSLPRSFTPFKRTALDPGMYGLQRDSKCFGEMINLLPLSFDWRYNKKEF
jgi:hypothetical protein